MNKITNYIFIFLLFFLYSCGYKAVLNNQNYQFSINVDKINGDRKINSQIINNFRQLGKNENRLSKLKGRKEKSFI